MVTANHAEQISKDLVQHCNRGQTWSIIPKQSPATMEVLIGLTTMEASRRCIARMHACM